MDLWGKFIPKLNWEVGVGSAEGSDESIFERLDGSFRRIHAMIVGLDELEGHFAGRQVSLDYFCRLIVHDV